MKGQVLEARGDFVGALRLYQAAYLEEPENETVLQGIAQCALALDELPTALDFFVRLLIQNHDNPWGYLGRASVLFRYGATDRALSDVASAILCDAPSSGLRIDIAALLNANGQSGFAADLLTPLYDAFVHDADYMAEYAFALICTRQTTLFERVTPWLESHAAEDPYYALLLAAAQYINGDETALATYRNILSKNDDLYEYSETLSLPTA